MNLNKINLKFFKIIGIILTLQGITFSANLTQAQPPTPPDTGTPEGDQTPGTTRPQANCKETNQPLTAIFANRGNDFTLSEYPTFWFYIPYAAQDIKYMEFLLIDETKKETIYHTAVQLAQQPGIIKVTIPSTPEYALKLNHTYYWRLNLNCKSSSTNQPDFVRGWVRRVPSNPQLDSQNSVNLNRYLGYRKNNIWYDAITELAELWFINPNNPELNQAWIELLKELGFEDIISEPLVQSQQLEPPEF